MSLLLYQGRELDVVSQAETLDHFRALHDDLGRLTRGIALLEAVDQLAQEREPNLRLYQMLLGALRALTTADSPLLVAAFFWKLLAAEGLQPELDSCVACGSPEPLVAFDLDQGGVLCRACRRGVPISAEALELLRRVLGGDLAAALRETAVGGHPRGRHARRARRWSTTSSAGSAPSACWARCDRASRQCARRGARRRSGARRAPLTGPSVGGPAGRRPPRRHPSGRPAPARR